jgi:hypothetical protein
VNDAENVNWDGFFLVVMMVVVGSSPRCVPVVVGTVVGTDVA